MTILPADQAGGTGGAFVRPQLTVKEAVEAFNEYQSLKKQLRASGDFVSFTDRDGQVIEAPTKSWRTKLTRFFGINVEIIDENMRVLPDGSFVVEATARASAGNGLYMVADGSCWSRTKEAFKGDLYHNTRSHACTRAKNRAVLELVGFGEVSAEELDGSEVSAGQPSGAGNSGGRRAGSAQRPAGATVSQKQFIYRLVAGFVPEVKAADGTPSPDETQAKRRQWLLDTYQVDVETCDKGTASDLITKLQARAQAGASVNPTTGQATSGTTSGA